MRNLSSLILCLAFPLGMVAQSPHGDDLALDCSVCHNEQSWKVDKASMTFNHSATQFPLTGQHTKLNCRNCHATLVFSKAGTECVSCHTDMHEQTVGQECERCHNTFSWIVSNITQIHQLSRFPLLGAHNTADCEQCHPYSNPASRFPGNSASYINFSPLGIECYDCHQSDYEAAKSPDHVAGNYSTNCTECHKMNAFDWTSTNINHNFFPLTGGHSLDCKQCHTDGTYSKLPSNCDYCHQEDYTNTSNPSHIDLGFPMDCSLCHSNNPGWKPASYTDHDAQYFPIYSGSHNGEWNSCTDCHSNPNNYAEFSCITCHEHNQGDMDDEHNEVGGYAYNSQACYECHPTGSGEGGFNHNLSNFPLTGAHLTTECAECHTTGYAGTSTVCVDCHDQDYNESSNPNHFTTAISTDCQLCHTTNPDWKPALFPTHNDYWVLNGAHALNASDCSACHHDDYNNTPNACMGCHEQDFNQTTNPPHPASQFPMDCMICHNETAWSPSTFNHTAIYALTGAHGSATCAACHQNGYSGTTTICFDCHNAAYSQSADPNHVVLGIPNTCETCHTTNPGWEPATFPIHNSYYPLAGAHADIANECALCHAGNYTNTPNTCYGCHEAAYNQTTNPPHQGAQFPTDCEACHTVNAWTPSTFDHDGAYFPIYSGSHNGEWDLCSDCHTNPNNYGIFSCIDCHAHLQPDMDEEHQGIGGYTYNSEACYACHPTGGGGAFNHNNTNFPLTGAHVSVECQLCHINGYPGTTTICSDCHNDAYSQSTNPNHAAIGIPNTCENCHTTNPGWAPAAFPIHSSYYLLTGAHAAISGDCYICHQGNYTSTPNSCFGCHEANYNQTSNPNHNTTGIPTTCEDCHTTNPGWAPATFPIHGNYYPLTGAHASVQNCEDCHAGNYTTTPNTCFDCHEPEYIQSSNPDHIAIGIPNNCENCHTTNPGWEPASFPIHSNYWPFQGAHAAISGDCDACHNGNYTSTPNTCYGCHSGDYNATTNPPHLSAGFPTDCELCHTQFAWVPSTFDHDNQYFPIYNGCHEGEWDQCSDCHPNPNNFAQFDCLSCHPAGETNGEHEGVPGYQYNSQACFNCHPDGCEEGPRRKVFKLN